MGDRRIIRAAIVGCGFVADQHAAQLRAQRDCEVVAACDSDALMASQLAERFRIAGVYTDAATMLREARPDTVHITTPAQSHYPLARLCLEAGAHVYVEKPFTVTSGETEEILELARGRGLRVTVGHNLQFTPESVRMRELVKAGVLGGPPVHLECIQCFSHEDPTYGRAVLVDPNHWVRRLPGSLLHNLISHGVGKLAEFLAGDRPAVISNGFTSPRVAALGQRDLVDEVRALIQDERGTTASFAFTTQLGAASNELRVHGPSGGVVVDNTYRTVFRIRPSRHKSYLRYFLAPWQQGWEQARNSIRGIRLFARHEFHMDYGMRKLIELFQQAIRGEGPDPIPPQEILRTARIMDALFAPLAGRRSAPTDRAT